MATSTYTYYTDDYYIDLKVTTSDPNYKFEVTQVGCDRVYLPGTDPGSQVTASWSASIGGSTFSSASKTFYENRGFTVNRSDSKIVGRTTSQRTLVFMFTVDERSGSTTRRYSTSATFTIAVKPSYSVTYYGNASGSTGVPTSQTKWYGDTLTLTSNTPSRTNYAFYHWNTSSTNSGTTYNPGGSYRENAALKLYAIWNPIIRFDANGGTTSSLPANQTKTYGQSMNLSSTVPTRTGYEFKRWNTSTSDPASTAYNKSASIAANDNLTKLLYAIWNPVISYDANGGSGAPVSSAKVFNETYTVSSAVPARTGYEFSGWNTVKGGSGTSYAPGATIAASMNTATTLYAQWTKVSDPPTISSLTVIRSNSSGTSDDAGTYCSVEAAWRVDTSIVSSNTGTVTGTIAPDGGSATAITFSSGASGTSGTAIALVPNCDTDTQYTITITVADSFTSTSRTDVMTRAKFIFDFKAGGDALGIGSAAPSDGLEIGWDTQFDENVTMLKDLAVSGNVSIAGSLTTPELTPTTYTSDIVDAATSWTVNSQYAYVMGKVIMISLDLTPTSTITPNVSVGVIATLKAAYRPKYNQGFGAYQGSGYVNTSGSIYFATTTRGITTSDHLYIGFTYLKS